MEWIALFETGGLLVLFAVFLGYLFKIGLGYALQQNVETYKAALHLEGQHQIERLRATEQLRLAVAAERFKAHQEAFAQWEGFRGELHRRERLTAALESARRWWTHNGLYLDADARKAFLDSINYASAFPHFYDEWRYWAGEKSRNPAKYEEVTRDLHVAWDVVQGAGSVIAQAVALPGLTESERKPFAAIGPEVETQSPQPWGERPSLRQEHPHERANPTPVG